MSSESENSDLKSSQIYLAWFICSAFFFYQYMIRVFPNIFTKEIFEAFKITAEEFGTLGSIYSLTYGAVQIPVGFLLDRTNIKKITLTAILLCIGGVLMFGMSKSFYLMQISRFIIALGSGAALGITLKIITANFIGTTRSVFSGLTLTIGVIGPILGGKIVEQVILFHDWRIVVIIIGMSGFVLFLGSLLFIKSTKYKNTTGFKENISQFKNVFNMPIFLYSIIAGGIYAPACVFGDLWGARFLTSKFGITESESINVSLSLYIGLAIGSLILPYFSEKIKRLNLVITISLISNVALFCVMLFIDKIEIDQLYFLVCTIGFFCGAEMICFNAAWYIVPKNSSALTVGILNSFSMIFNAIFQYVVGALMDMMWDGKYSEDGLRIYTQDNFILGISSVPIVLMICFVISLALTKKVKLGQEISQSV